MIHNISHTRWDDLILNGQVTDKDNQSIDLTGSTIKYWLSYSQSRDTFLNWDATITDISWGEYNISIPASVTTDWELRNIYMDIQLTDSNSVVTTIWQVIISVTYDVIQ